MTTPFIVYGLARSRTAWLAKFLSYREWSCHHEQAIFMRTMDDVKALLSRPNTGCVETAIAQGRPLIRHVFPNIKEVVVLRPVEEVINSMKALYTQHGLTYDEVKLRKLMKQGDKLLREISEDSRVLTVSYGDLDLPEACADIFEHCLPYKFNLKWWSSLKHKNIQTDVRALVNYYWQNKDGIEGFKKHCKLELIRLFRAGEIHRETSHAVI